MLAGGPFHASLQSICAVAAFVSLCVPLDTVQCVQPIIHERPLGVSFGGLGFPGGPCGFLTSKDNHCREQGVLFRHILQPFVKQPSKCSIVLLLVQVAAVPSTSSSDAVSAASAQTRPGIHGLHSPWTAAARLAHQTSKLDLAEASTSEHLQQNPGMQAAQHDSQESLQKAQENSWSGISTRRSIQARWMASRAQTLPRW